jgi:hypothetical protein
MYKTSISEIQDFMRCRFRWWCKYVHNQVPREESPALKLGSFIHEIFETQARLKKSMPDAISIVQHNWACHAAHTTDSYERDARLKALQSLNDFGEALEQWEDEYDCETLEVEEPFEYQLLPDVIIQGRPDRVVLMNDRLWHVQNRGLAPGVNFGVYLELAKRHYHEHLYARALMEKYPDHPYGGTIFNLVRKLKYRTKNGEVKSLSEMFFQHPMSIDPESSLHKNIIDSIKYHCNAMIVLRKSDKPPAPNEFMNGGPYNNSPDVYFKVLIGEIELGDSRYFKPREERYETVTVRDN